MSPKDPKFGTKLQVLSLAFELGYIIAIPLLAFILAGKYLDEKWGTDPWLKIAGLLIALATTTFWLTQRFREVLRSMNNKNNDKTS